MDNIIYSTLLLLLTASCHGSLLRGAARRVESKPMQNLTYLTTPFAYDLVNNEESQDFFRYQLGWDAQINLFDCSIASAAAIVNSILPKDDLPVDPLLAPEHYATQAILNVTNLDCINKKVIIRNETFDGLQHYPYGLPLVKAGEQIKCFVPSDYNVTTIYAEDVSYQMMKDDLIEALMDPASRVAINYHRSEVGQVGGGHISPLGGYNADLDAFLVMDVNKGKYPPAWIPASILYDAMLTRDLCGEFDHLRQGELIQPVVSAEETAQADVILGCKSKSRGYIIVTQN